MSGCRLPSADTLADIFIAGTFVTVNAIATTMKENDKEDKACGAGNDYLNPNFLVKASTMGHTIATAPRVYGNFKKAKTFESSFSLPTLLALGGSIGTLVGAWGATGYKANMACRVLNPLFNLFAAGLSNKHRDAALEKARSLEGDLERPQQYAGVHLGQQPGEGAYRPLVPTRPGG